jgi:HAMP domain-containing protein
MTIRWQIICFITLLFLGVGIIGGAGARWLETEVVRHAFDDSAHALAVSVAEFIEPADIAALEGGAPLAKTRLGTVWSRLERWAIVKRLFLVDRSSGRVLADTAPAGTPLPDSAALQGLASEEVRSLPLRVTDDGHSLLPLVALAANGTAVVGVETSADDYLQQRAAIAFDVKVDAVMAVLVGLVVAAGLSWLVSRPILRLGNSVDQVGATAFSDEVADSVIREVADLGNTFGVMHSVLGEAMGKGRRVLLESDLYRSESSLAAAYRRELQPPAAWSGAGAQAAWLSTGAPPPAVLAGAITLGAASGAAFAGAAASVGELASAVHARAAAAYLADALARQPLAAAAAETQSLFGLGQLIAVRWTGDTLECWRGGGDPSGPGPDPAAWVAGDPVALACLGAINRNRLELYLTTFPTHAADRLLVELPPLLDAAEPGVVLVLRRSI